MRSAGAHSQRRPRATSACRVLSKPPSDVLSRVCQRGARKDNPSKTQVFYVTGKHARPASGRRPLRAPDPLLESQNGSLHLRRPQQDSHYQPGAHGSRFQPGAGTGQTSGHVRQQDFICRHQARGGQDCQRTGRARRYALRQPPLAGRDAHQLQDHSRLYQAPART